LNKWTDSATDPDVRISAEGKQISSEEEKLHEQKTKICKRILLVDDEPDSCMVYQIVLEDAGYECKSYTDSVKA
jgi:PleD family two-component response regulator